MGFCFSYTCITPNQLHNLIRDLLGFLLLWLSDLHLGKTIVIIPIVIILILQYCNNVRKIPEVTFTLGILVLGCPDSP